MIVLDASAVVEWLLRLPLADAVDEWVADPDRSLHAPHLLSIEVAQVVRRYERRGEIAATRGAEALSDLADLDISYHPHLPLLEWVWERRANLTAYDAVYVALAEALDATLVTLDTALAAAPLSHARIECLG